MRLNKKKLAALAMSAVMAASTMPFPVMAEEFVSGDAVVETFADGEATPVEDPGAQPVKVKKVTIDKTGKVTVLYSNGTKDETTYTAVITTREATCTAGKKVVGTVVIGGTTYEQTLEEGAPLEHKQKAVSEWVITKGATCEHSGLKDEVVKCSVCGEVLVTINKDVVIPAGKHSYGEPYTIRENVENGNLDANFNLINKDADGKYDLVTYEKCSECGDKHEIKRVHMTVPSENTKITKKVVVTDETSNIAVSVATWNPDKLPADSDIELSDCTKDGVYWIYSYNSSNDLISTEAHVVPAHHVTKVDYETVKATESSLLDVVKDKTTGKVVAVQSNSCYKSVQYYEITTCTATGCKLPGKLVSKEEKTAQPKGTHVNSYVTWVNTTINENKKDGALTETGYKRLKQPEAAMGFKVTRDGDCEEESTVTITFTCEACGEAMPNPITVKCAEMHHDWSNPTIENKVEPTCFKDGSYDTVQTCKICGKKEVIRTGVVIPATKEHSFIDDGKTDYTDVHIQFTGTKVVDKDGQNLDNKGKTYVANDWQSSYSVSAVAAIKCEFCGEEIPQDVKPALTVVDITKETAKEAGSITIKAVWKTPADDKGVVRLIEDTYTVPYYSSLAAYLERDPAKDPINGLHKDEDGVWRYYENNEVTDFTGIAEYQGGKFFVANGVLCSDAKGLNLYNGEWYFLAGGQIQTQVTGLAMYNGEWFFLTDGKLDRSKTGLVEYDGAKFIIAKGELQRYSGLWQDPADGTWYFAALGQIQEQYTGTAIYDGQTFELVNGKLVR